MISRCDHVVLAGTRAQVATRSHHTERRAARSAGLDRPSCLTFTPLDLETGDLTAPLTGGDVCRLVRAST